MVTYALLAAAVAAMTGSALAQSNTDLTIVIEACSGGTGCSNKTIHQFVGMQGQLGGSCLKEDLFAITALTSTQGIPASNLYLTDASGVDINSVTCQIFEQNVTRGPTFTYANPALLSTNTVQIHGLSCDSSSGSTTSGSSMTIGAPVSARTVVPTPGSAGPFSNGTTATASETVKPTTLQNGSVSMTTIQATSTPAPGSNSSSPPIQPVNGAESAVAQTGLVVLAAVGAAFAYML